MKFMNFSTLFLLGGALAAPAKIVARDLTVIQYNIQRVDYYMQQLLRTFGERVAYDQASQQQHWTNILQISQNIIQELTTGGNEIRRGPDVNAVEGLTLISISNGIVATTEKVAAGYLQNKKAAAAIGAQAAVLDGLIYFSMQSGSFMDAILSKTNFISQFVGSSYRSRVITAIDKAVAEYKKK